MSEATCRWAVGPLGGVFKCSMPPEWWCACKGHYETYQEAEVAAVGFELDTMPEEQCP